MHACVPLHFAAKVRFAAFRQGLEASEMAADQVVAQHGEQSHGHRVLVQKFSRLDRETNVLELDVKKSALPIVWLYVPRAQFFSDQLLEICHTSESIQWDDLSHE